MKTILSLIACLLFAASVRGDSASDARAAIALSSVGAAPKFCPCSCGCDADHACKCEAGKCKCDCGCNKDGACPCKGQAPAHSYRWVEGDDSDQVHLYDGDTQVGTWRRDLNQYYPFDAETGRWKFPAPFPPRGCPKIPARPAKVQLLQAVPCST
jgi:hypothetical protein